MTHVFVCKVLIILMLVHIIDTARDIQFVAVPHVRTIEPVRYRAQDGVGAGPHPAHQGRASFADGRIKAVYECFSDGRTSSNIYIIL